MPAHAANAATLLPLAPDGDVGAKPGPSVRWASRIHLSHPRLPTGGPSSAFASRALHGRRVPNAYNRMPFHGKRLERQQTDHREIATPRRALGGKARSITRGHAHHPHHAIISNSKVLLLYNCPILPPRAKRRPIGHDAQTERHRARVLPGRCGSAGRKPPRSRDRSIDGDRNSSILSPAPNERCRRSWRWMAKNGTRARRRA